MCQNTAQEVVGEKPKIQTKHHTSDPIVVVMSDERHKLMGQLNSNTWRDRTELRSKINKLKNEIKKRLKYLKEQRANSIAEEINSTDDCRRMFEAVKLLKGGRDMK